MEINFYWNSFKNRFYNDFLKIKIFVKPKRKLLLYPNVQRVLLLFWRDEETSFRSYWWSKERSDSRNSQKLLWTRSGSPENVSAGHSTSSCSEKIHFVKNFWCTNINLGQHPVFKQRNNTHILSTSEVEFLHILKVQ